MSALNLPAIQEEKFGKAIGVSIILHSLILSFFLIKSVFLPSEDLEYQSAVRVDIVDLPDKIQEQAPTSPATDAPSTATEMKDRAEPVTPEPKAAEKKPSPKEETVSLKKTKNKQQDAINKLKRLSAIDKIKQELAEKKATAGAKSQKFKGNILSAGTDLKGLDKLQHESYQSNIDRHVKKNWALPEWLAKKNLRAQIRVKLDERGNVIASQIVRSSGNPTYDEIVVEAIKNSSPFPAPPEKFIDIVAIQGILLGFPE